MSELSVLEAPNDTQLVDQRDVWLLGEADVQALGATAGNPYIFADFEHARAGEHPYRQPGKRFVATTPSSSFS